ncbi:MAG: protein translocase subunit SecD [Bradymonadia bacterium]
MVSILSLVPTLANTFAEEGQEAELPEWFTDVFSSKLILGLDLQGGIHLQYRVDIEEALARKSGQLAGQLEINIKDELKTDAKATAGNPEGSLEEVTTLTVVFSNAADAEKLDSSFLGKFLPDYEVGAADGANVTLVMRNEAIDQFRQDSLERAMETVDRRINEFGLTESTISRRGDNELVVQLPGIKESEFAAAKEKLARTGQLRFQIVDRAGASAWVQKLGARIPTAANWPAELDPSLKEHKVVQVDGTIRSTSREILDYIVEGQIDDEHIAGFEELFVDPTTGNLRRLDKLTKEQEDALSKVKSFSPKATAYKGYQLVYLRRKDGVSGENVIDSRVGYDQFNKPEVYLTFGPQDVDAVCDLTTKFTREQMAIMIDEIVYSAPNIKEKICGPNMRITLGSVGRQAIKEASSLVAVLKSGALQAPLRKLYDSQVGPSLGADSVSAGQTSVIIGLVLVIAFMFIYYKGAGLVADVALILNLLFVMACLTGFGATLTLPGIAGIVLTVGMAVDANVLIFERIREELREGKPVRQAIDTGFQKAFSAIFDANVTTAIAAVVLYQFGSGPIRGFAVTLAIGIICSVFTALVVTRLIFDYVYGRGAAPAKMSI